MAWESFRYSAIKMGVMHMSSEVGVVSFVFGCVMGVYALKGRHFYWLKGGNHGDKETPLWAGRLFVGAISALFIFAGLRILIVNNLN